MKSICPWLALTALVLVAVPTCFAQSQPAPSRLTQPPATLTRGAPSTSTPAKRSLAAPELNNQTITIPLEFETNQGQAPARYLFVAHGPAYTLGLSATEMALSLHRQQQSSSSTRDPISLQATESANVEMRLVGGNSAAAADGLDPQPGRSNYFIGNDPAKWQTNVPQFGRVKFAAVYPGIDLVLHGNHQQLEYDFDLAAGADPSAIRVEAHGAQSVTIAADGNALLHTALGDVELKRPEAYQEIAGVRQPVKSAYRLVDSDDLAFEVGAYDHNKALTIDPVLDYGVSLGGSNGNWATGIAVDGNGDAYVSGATCSGDFPTTAGNFQQFPSTPSMTSYINCMAGFVVKLDPTGSTLLYSDYFGGTNNSSGGSHLTVDGSGDVYLTGGTTATDFPTVANIGPSAPSSCSQVGSGDLCLTGFVLKLNPTGSQIIFSSLLGGSQGSGAAEVKLNPVTGDVVVLGDTDSANFLPAATTLETSYGGGSCGSIGPCYNGFLLGLNPTTGALRYGTFIGGTGNDLAGGLAFDSSGNIYVAGSTQPPLASALGSVTQTYSPAGGATAAGAEIFVEKFDLSGTTLTPGYLTIIQGDADTQPGEIAVDSANNLYFAGATAGKHLPVTPNAFQTTNNATGGPSCFPSLWSWPFFPNACGTAIVGGLNSAGALSFLTYLGGSTQDAGARIGIDSNKNLWIGGVTSSTDFPFAADQYIFPGGFFTPFLAEMSNDGKKLLDATPVGSTFSQVCDLAIDASNNVYIVGYTGQAPSTPGTFPADPAVYQPGFVQKWSAGTPPSLSFSATGLGFNATIGAASPPQSITIQNTGTTAAELGIQLSPGYSTSPVSDFLESTTCGTTLAADSSCTITVTFAPGPPLASCVLPNCSPSSRAAAIVISDNAIQGNQTIQLSGGAAVGPAIAISPDPIVFAPQTAGTSSAPLYVSNTSDGDSPLVTSSIALSGPNASDFQLTLTGVGQNCIGSVAPETYCAFEVTFNPPASATGTRTATLTLIDNAGDSPQVVPVSGTVAGSYALNISPLTLTSEFPTAFGTSTYSVLDIENLSATNTIQVTSLAISGTNASDFSLMSASCTAAGSLPMTIAPGATCYADINFDPAAGESGLRTATLTVGTSPAIDGLPTVSLQSDAVTNSQPAMSFFTVPSPMNFGGVQVGETSNNESVLFSITNNYPIPCAGGASTCGAPLVINSITPGLPDYTLSAGGQSGVCAPFPVTIPIGSNCTFSIIFTPVAGGLRNTTLTIQSNDPQGTMQLPVFGAGLTLPLGEFLQTALNFGNCAIGVPCPALTTTLLNGGQSNLAISGVNASANFAIQANTCTGMLAPQATCTITVTFAPPSAGFFSGTLTVTDNDQFGSQQSVTLTGTGATGQQLRLMPPTVNFGDQSFNTTSEPRTITLTSTGDTAVTFPANAINTTPDFLLESTTCTGSLPTGSSCTANVQFKPTNLELEGFGESGSMKATDGATGSPQLVYMQGIGTEGTTAASTTTLASSINPSAGGQAITFMAAVTGPSGNSTVPTGTVNFLDGSAMIGGGTLNGRGIAAYSTSSLGAGSHSITAVYGGDANFNGSTSNLVTQVVNSLTVPVITWTPASTIVHGGAGSNVLNASANTSGSFTYSATPIAGGAPINITSGTSMLAVGSYNLTANFTPANTGVYDSAQATATLLVSGESVWIVNGTGGLSELAGNGYGITSSADPGANLAVAIDGSGNVWTVGSGPTLLEETNQAGASLNTISSGSGGLNSPAAIAIDGNGQIWTVNGDNSVSLFSNAGTALSPSTGFIGATLSTPSGVAVDLSGSVWITNKGSNSVTRILGAAAPAAPLSTAALNQTTGEKP